MTNNERLRYVMKSWGETVSVDEEVRGGVPCLKGHRITVGHMLAEIFGNPNVIKCIDDVADSYNIDPKQLRDLTEFLSIFFDCKGVGIWTDKPYLTD